MRNRQELLFKHRRELAIGGSKGVPLWYFPRSMDSLCLGFLRVSASHPLVSWSRCRSPETLQGLDKKRFISRKSPAVSGSPTKRPKSPLLWQPKSRCGIRPRPRFGATFLSRLQQRPLGLMDFTIGLEPSVWEQTSLKRCGML